MTGALAVGDDQQDWTEVQKAALAQLGVGEAPRGDQLVFLHVSQRMNLDPFNKEIYMIGRWDPEAGKKKWAIQVGIDGFRSKSEEHPQFAGVGNVEWCGPDGVWTDVWLSEQPPAAARFTVYRKDQEGPIRAVAIYREYVQTKKDGNPTQRWRNAAAAQLGKCSEALTRRTAFPRQLGGVYIPEELDHLDNPQPPPVVIEAEVEPAEPDWDALLTQYEGSVADLWELRALAKGMRPNDSPLLNKIAQAWQRAKDAEGAAATEGKPDPVADAAATQPALQVQMRRIFALLKKRGIGDDGHLAAASTVLQRDITSFKDLTANDASKLIDQLEKLERETPVTTQQSDDTKGDQP